MKKLICSKPEQETKQNKTLKHKTRGKKKKRSKRKTIKTLKKKNKKKFNKQTNPPNPCFRMPKRLVVAGPFSHHHRGPVEDAEVLPRLQTHLVRVKGGGLVGGRSSRKNKVFWMFLDKTKLFG